jgi:hypothetical protein
VFGISAQAEAPIDGTATATSAASAGGSVLGLPDSAANAYALSVAEPAAASVATALARHPIADAALGGSGSSVFGSGAQGAAYAALASGAQDYQTSIDWTFDTNGLTGDLDVAFLDASIADSGFVSLAFTITENGATAVSEDFTSASAAEAFFTDDTLDLGVVPFSETVALDIDFDLTATTPGADAGATYLVGTTGASPPGTPPVFTGPSSLDLVTGQATALLGYSIAQADAQPGETFVVTLTDTSGILASTAALGGTVSAAGTTLRLTGSLAAVNAELAATTYTGAPLTGTAPAADRIQVAVANSLGGTDSIATAVDVSLPATIAFSAFQVSMGTDIPPVGNGAGAPILSAEQLAGEVAVTPVVLNGVAFARIDSLLDWNALKNLSFTLQSADAAADGTNFVFFNFVNTDVDLTAAGAAALTVDVLGSKRGVVTLGDGDNTVLWAGQSNQSWSNTVDITVGNGNNTITVEGVGQTSLDNTLLLRNYDESDSAFYWDPNYDGQYTSADVTLGSGANTVTLAGSGNTVAAASTSGTDYIDAGTGESTITGGGGDFVVLAGGLGNHVTLGNGADMVFISPAGTNPSVPAGTVAPVDQGRAVVTTGSGNDTIDLGGYGNVVDAGGGTNTIQGGLGQDRFVLPTLGAGLDIITNFTETNGDVLDLRPALTATAWNGEAADLSQFVTITTSGSNASVAVSAVPGGAGTTIATLVGTGTTTLSSLLSHDAILTG